MFVAYHRPYTLDDVQKAIAEVASLVHASPEVLRLKIKELVAEYAEPGTATAEAEKRGPEKPIVAPTRRTGPPPQEPRYVP